MASNSNRYDVFTADQNTPKLVQPSLQYNLAQQLADKVYLDSKKQATVIVTDKRSNPVYVRSAIANSNNIN